MLCSVMIRIIRCAKCDDSVSFGQSKRRSISNSDHVYKSGAYSSVSDSATFSRPTALNDGIDLHGHPAAITGQVTVVIVQIKTKKV